MELYSPCETHESLSNLESFYPGCRSLLAFCLAFTFGNSQHCKLCEEDTAKLICFQFSSGKKKKIKKLFFLFSLLSPSVCSIAKNSTSWTTYFVPVLFQNIRAELYRCELQIKCYIVKVIIGTATVTNYWHRKHETTASQIGCFQELCEAWWGRQMHSGWWTCCRKSKEKSTSF